MHDSVPVAAPLAGRRVVTTRGTSAGDRLRTLLGEAGASVVTWPTCEYPPPRDPALLEAALARLDRFDWVVFTSARAVARVGGAAPAPPTVRDPAGAPATSPGPSPRVAVVGPATARAATMAGWTVAVEGRGPGARDLAAGVAATFPLAGARVLFPAGSGAAATVEEEFTALGARVTRVEAYRTVVTPPPAGQVRADLAAGVDAVTFASPAAVEAVDRALGGEMARTLAGVAVVCIGPTTGAALARRGVAGVQMAATPTLAGIVDALVEWFGGAGGSASARGAGHSSSAVAGHSSSAVGRADVDLGRGKAVNTNARGAGRADATAGTAGPADAAIGGNTASEARPRPGDRPHSSPRLGARADTTVVSASQPGARP